MGGLGCWPRSALSDQEPEAPGDDAGDGVRAMEIVKVELDRAALVAMPENERVLLLLLAHACNEIIVIHNLILTPRKEEPSLPIEFQAGREFILIRLLIGKLHEAWELFKKRAQADRAIRDKFIPQLPIQAANALQELNHHFGQGSPLSLIRNKISFHYEDEDNLTEANFQQLPSTEALHFYLSRTDGNTFYHAGEVVAQLSAASLMKVPPNPKDARTATARALEALCNEVVSVSWNIVALFSQMITHLSWNAVKIEPTKSIPNRPKI